MYTTISFRIDTPPSSHGDRCDHVFQLVGVAHEPDRGDPGVGDLEGGDEVDLVTEGGDDAGVAVDQGRHDAGMRVRPSGKGDEVAGAPRGSDEGPASRWAGRPAVAHAHNIGSQSFEYRVKVAVGDRREQL